MRPIRSFAALLVAGLLAGSASAQQSVVLSTGATGTWSGLFGTASGAFESYGQTFSVPGAQSRTLQDFSFWLKQGHHSPNRPIFHAYVYEWNTATNRTTGPELWRSATTRTGPTSTSSYTQFTWQPTGVVLEPGKVYVAFLSTQGLTQSSGHGSIKFEARDNSTYPTAPVGILESEMVRLDGQSAAWHGTTWNHSTSTDLRFTATLVTAVPEPGTYAMLATGLVGLAVAARRRRR